jgi:hypothetical protein
VGIVAVVPAGPDPIPIRLKCFSRHLRGIITRIEQPKMISSAKIVYIGLGPYCKWATVLIQCQVENDMNDFSISAANGLPVTVTVSFGIF